MKNLNLILEECNKSVEKISSLIQLPTAKVSNQIFSLLFFSKLLDTKDSLSDKFKVLYSLYIHNTLNSKDTCIPLRFNDPLVDLNTTFHELSFHMSFLDKKTLQPILSYYFQKYNLAFSSTANLRLNILLYLILENNKLLEMEVDNSPLMYSFIRITHSANLLSINDLIDPITFHKLFELDVF